ncbi:deoxyribonuclease-2-beta-like [Etheostoma cragini]|uniref:deoxyribonuclease-2-beta-like n=1 Tax=Etheostoma cragini TaxID=417921 RepID=UPI00155F3080|nr:deoxyribonuclease-2-beta-like [Etheostoma cragini]
MYKVPKLNNQGTEGLEYLYIDSNGNIETSKDHSKLINDPDGVLGNTLKPLLKLPTSMPKDFGFITYNDQPPPDDKGVTPSVNSKFGHSKGLVMMDKTTGVWLLHSVPKFPFKRDNNFYPTSGAAKAQTFICVTFKYAEFQKIGQHLLDIAAFPFESHFPADFHDQLKKAAIIKWNNREPGEKIQDLESDAGTQFKSIAKKLYKGKMSACWLESEDLT